MPQPYEKLLLNKKTIFFNNLIGGVGWAIGATIGLSLVVAILSFIAHQINVIPFIGKFISDIIDFVLQYNHHV